MATTSVSVDLEAAMASLDLARRLERIPAQAANRGFFFNMLRDDLERRGLLGLRDVNRLLGVGRRSWALYPARELVEACAIAGALVHSDVHEGMRQIFSASPRAFASTWYGRAFTRFLHPDPSAGYAWVARSREYVSNYGKWRFEPRGPGHAIMHLFGEYFWIDSALRGGCEGVLAACGVTGEVHAELDDDFNGRHIIRWQLPS